MRSHQPNTHRETMTAAAPESALREVSNHVLRYFKEFLATDFKRLQAPRRRIQLKTQEGFRAGIDLRKYPNLFRDAWALLGKPPQEMSLRFGRRTYRAQISPVLRDLIEQYVGQVPEQDILDVRARVLGFAQDRRPQGGVNPEAYAASVLDDFQQATLRQVVMPLLALLEGPFRENAYSAEESVYEVQSDLTTMLCASACEHLPPALNALLLTGDTLPLEQVLQEFFAHDTVRAQVLEFFEVFAAADAFQELREVLNFVGSNDQLTTYLYVGALKFNQNDYPLFYLPVSVRPQSDGAGYVLTLDPRLYVHKQAIEYVAAEMRHAAQRVSTAVVPERILHLEEDQTAQARIDRIMRDLARTFDVASQIDFSQHQPQTARSPQLRLSNAAHLAAFDRSDESLVNDYEALLSSLEEDHQEAAAMFHDIVRSMLFDDPASVSRAVREDWDRMTPAQRLVTSSPIPLNEEQIRIDCARRQPGCRFIAVEGPPGTGKSHTITALAFNAIMDHQSVLIVSDKNEALDVVQDKLTQALLAVRTGEDFPNPILRLGKDGTYRSLISGAARVRIQNHHAAQRGHMPSLERELGTRARDLSERIECAVSVISSVSMADVARLHALEAQLEASHPGLPGALEALARGGACGALAQSLAAWTPTHREALLQLAPQALQVDDLMQRVRVEALVQQLMPHVLEPQRHAMALFQPLAASQLPVLLAFISRIAALRLPVIGYLFRGGALAALDAEMAAALASVAPIGLSRRLDDLQLVAGVLGRLGQAARELGAEDDATAIAYGRLAREGSSVRPQIHEGAVALLSQLQQLLAASPAAQAALASGRHEGAVAARLLQVADVLVLGHQLRSHLAQVPEIDFVADKARLESLNTARLAHRLDSRFLDFVENNRATAQALGGVIRQRAQFPVDQFKTLRDAFPCVIAGIRELGEFVPLKTGVFDLLIIDEGSQVSVAQAMPAMLRAQQVVIFGDRRQFSNVKSHNASNATNASYLSTLQDPFRDHVTTAADKIERLRRFDVKRSVLEFVALVANHQEMLRKHFRGYPELISYSSQNFYDGALQAIKVRPVPVDEVIRFEVLPHEGRAEAKRNVNTVEAEYIMEVLEELASQDEPPTVAIITPHTEQVALIAGLVSRHTLGEVFEDRLRLKVFSFDTCQGEERDLIIYSMVATRERDVLNYIFPVRLDANEDENETLKAQRLNVGFSRAKEAMLFVLSKPPEEFRGTIGQALMHFKRLLIERPVAQDGNIDPNSPTQRKLLGWLKATPFFQQQADRLELIAQFPVEDYLRQLDPLYQHPAYKCDFLLRHMAPDGALTQVVIEYDGFEEHFVERDNVHAAKHERYYRPEDIERQFVLESYGYRFLRVNRFNLGSDPVQTLDDRLRRLIAAGAQNAEDAESVSRIKAQAEALDNRQARQCQRCQEVKDLPDFFDPGLGGGAGGYGRVCMACKVPAESRSTGAKPAHRSKFKRRW